MAALGATVPPRKDAFQALAAQPLTQAEMACHTGLTNRTAFGLVQARLEVEVHPELIANGFLYDPHALQRSAVSREPEEAEFATIGLGVCP